MMINSNVNQERIQNQIENADNKKDDKELKDVCRQFEAYFIDQMMKQMRKSVPEEGLVKKSQGEKIFEDMLFQEYATESTQGEGIGIAKMLYEQLANKKWQ